MNAKDKILVAVWNGAETSDEITDATGYAFKTVQKKLGELADDGTLGRERNGRSYVYSVADESAVDGLPLDANSDVPEPSDEAKDALESAIAEARAFDPVTGGREFGIFGGAPGVKPDRDYDFSDRIPGPTEYLSTNGEWEEIYSSAKNRELVNNPVRVVLGGPNGAGKTTLPTALAHEFDAPVFTVQGSYALKPSDIIGRPFINDGNTEWIDAEVTKALISSIEQPTVLILDEVNRARPQAKGELFSVLDHRATLQLPFTGEVVKGNPMNLMVFSTMNEGPGFITEKLDLAEADRLGEKYDVQYLGVEHPDREAELIASRVPVAEGFARDLVDVANHIRALASDTSSSVSRGVPTRRLVRWAALSLSFDVDGLDDPAVRAGESAIVRSIYRKDGMDTDAAVEVREFIGGKLRGAHADPEKYLAERMDTYAESDDEFESDPDSAVECFECSFMTTRGKADDADLLVNYVCPDCGGDLYLP